MEGIKALKPDSTLDKFNPQSKLSKKLPPYLRHMNETDKETNLRLVQSMNKKITFLKNPRTIGPGTKLGTLGKDNPFRVEPEAVVFTEYDEGGVYEIPLVVTNVASLMRRITVLPPSTPNFSIGSVKYPDDSHGLVAPGMSVTVMVHFHAEAQPEYDDELTFKTEQNTFTIPLRARREPPKLTLVDVMDCGTTWIGDRMDMVFKCKNLGGSAGFKFFHELEEFDAPPGEEVLTTGPFSVFPLQFYLVTGQTIEIYVCFQPTEEGIVESKVILACDNQTSQFYTLKGQGAALDLAVKQIDDKQLDYNHNPLSSVWFEPTFPNSQATRTLHICNNSPLPVPFHWSIFTGTDHSIVIGSPDHHYSISPDKGLLEPGGTGIFTIDFFPNHSLPFLELADFFVEDIPLGSLTKVAEQIVQSSLFQEAGNQFIGSNTQHPAIPYLQFELHGTGSTCELELDPPFYNFSHDITINYSYTAGVSLKNKSKGPANYILEYLTNKSSSDFIVETEHAQGLVENGGVVNVEFTVLAQSIGPKVAVFKVLVEHGNPFYFQITATCVGPQIILEESDCNFGLVRCNELSSVMIPIENLSPVEAKVAIGLDSQELSFSEQNPPPDSRILITPSLLTLGPNERREIQVSILDNQDEIIEAVIQVKAQHGNTCYVNLYGDVQSPAVYLDTMEFELGELSAGIPSTEQIVRLVNFSNLSARFKWTSVRKEEALSIYPFKGVIEPHSAVICTFTVTAVTGGALDAYFECNLVGMEFPLIMRATGQVKGLEVIYLSEDTALHTTLAQGASLLPPSLYNPSERESFLSKTNLLAGESQLSQLDFGNVNIGEAKVLKFIMKNLSGLTANFELKSERFEPNVREEDIEARKKAKEAQARQFEESGNTRSPRKIKFAAGTKNSKNQREKLPPLLTDAHEQQNKFSTKEGETFTMTKKLERSQKFYLSSGRGLAFVCEPRSGLIEAYSEVTVTVTIYNDICGRFEDVLCSIVQGLEPVSIPMKVRVRGSPLQLAPHQLGVDYHKDPPLLNLGNIPIGKESLSRQIKLFNSGPKNISLNWSVFNYSDLTNRQDDIFKVSFAPTGIESGNADLLDVKFTALPPAGAECPFTVSPLNVVIGGRRFQNFNINFSSDAETLHEAVIIAHPALEDESEDSKLGDMGIQLKALSIQPWLHIDKVKRVDEFYYLTFDAYAIGGPSPSKEISLMNVSPSNLSFRAVIESGPFIITAYKNSASLYLQDYEGASVADMVETLKLKRTSSNVKLTDQKHTLSPESNLLITLKLIKPNPNDFDAWPESSKTTLTGSMLINFTNGTSQRIKLEGRLYRPKLMLSAEQADEFKEITDQDFGAVTLGDQLKITLYLSNQSPVEARWKLNYLKYIPNKRAPQRTLTSKEIEDRSATDDPEVFKFAASEGSIQGPTVAHWFAPCGPALPQAVKPELEKVPLALQILFKPTAAKQYKSRYAIQVEGGSSVSFVLKGTGVRAN